MTRLIPCSLIALNRFFEFKLVEHKHESFFNKYLNINKEINPRKLNILNNKNNNKSSLLTNIDDQINIKYNLNMKLKLKKML